MNGWEMSECLYEWIRGEGWRDGWRWIDGRLARWIAGPTDEWEDGWMGGWMDLDRRKGGKMD